MSIHIKCLFKINVKLYIYEDYMYNLYLKYLRYRIRRCNTIDDFIKVIKNIDYFHKDINSDKLCDIIIQCLQLYPLSNDELQKISILQQQYDSELGIYNYVTFILWVSSIQSIQEIHNSNNTIDNSANNLNTIDNYNTSIVVSPWGNSIGFHILDMINLLYRLKSIITFNKL